jgi:hypothetical protein
MRHAPVRRDRDPNATARAVEAYRLWLRGYSFRRIAEALGYSDPSAAYKAWQRARQAMIAPPDLEAERQRERDRLETAYEAIAERVEKGELLERRSSSYAACMAIA